jgi:hypothetical protein
MSQLQQTYSYDKLPQGDAFRYLVLQPGAGDESLVCDLQTAPINDTPFEAVSYVWGTSPKAHPIICQGHVINITPSLADVLRRVRLQSSPIRVWADSVCINQTDPLEKGNQVALMGKIYRSASRVLIHIGSDDGGQGPAVCSLLDEIDSLIQATCKTIDMSWDSFPYPDEGDPLLIDHRWQALHTLLKQNWFDRGWVIQEAASTPEGQLLWGQSKLDWGKLMRVYIWLSTRASGIYYSRLFSEVPINCHSHVYLESHKDFGRAFYSKLSWGSPSLLRTLNCAKELDLTDPRDRIYAFMDLPQKFEHQITLHPDYTISHLETYRQFAAEYIRSTKSTGLLDYVSHTEESLLDEVPSWVPRWDIVTWSLSPTSMASTIASSRTGSVIAPTIVNASSLRVRGVIFDKVHFASELLDWNTTTETTLLGIWNRVVKASLDCPYVASSKPCLLEAFLNSLSAGTYDGEVSEWLRAKESFAHGVEMRLDEDSPSEDAVGGAEDDSSLFVEHIKSRTDNRKFILTDRGYMGLAPAVVKETDTCSIVFECRTPCVLRRAGQDQQYTYLGAISLVGKERHRMEDGTMSFSSVLGEDDSKDWVEWEVDEQDIDLC